MHKKHRVDRHHISFSDGGRFRRLIPSLNDGAHAALCLCFSIETGRGGCYGDEGQTKAGMVMMMVVQ
jgi:hypothetical protein